MFGRLSAQQAKERGGINFTVDMDPRWVKQLIAAGRAAEAEAYADHLIEQAAHILRTQRVGLLVTTPPLLERLSRDDELVALVNEKIEVIGWGGAHMDADTRHLLAARLAAIPSLPPESDEAVLPVQPVDTARAIEKYLMDRAAAARAWLGADGIVEELGDGSAVLRPAVHQVDRPGAEQVNVELGFPCVWVAPWSREDGVAPLRESLVLTALTGDESIIDALLAEPTIANLYLGDHPTYWIEPGIPHDDYLSAFLMRSKAVIRD